MEINEIISKVESSAVYTDWKADNPSYYLVHYFMMNGQPSQIGYYSEESDNVVSFMIEDEIKMNPPEESLKKGGVIPPLNLDEVKIDISNALESALNLQKEEYSDQIINKHMLILQMLDDIATYNVTLISTAFNFMNIRISAVDGSVISHKKSSIIDLKKED